MCLFYEKLPFYNPPPNNFRSDVPALSVTDQGLVTSAYISPCSYTSPGVNIRDEMIRYIERDFVMRRGSDDCKDLFQKACNRADRMMLIFKLQP